jgi:hypothetical protein
MPPGGESCAPPKKEKRKKGDGFIFCTKKGDGFIFCTRRTTLTRHRSEKINPSLFPARGAPQATKPPTARIV